MRVEGLSGSSLIVTRDVKPNDDAAFSQEFGRQGAGQSKGNPEPEADAAVGSVNQASVAEPDTWIEVVASTQTLDTLANMHPVQHSVPDYGDEFAEGDERIE